MKTTHKCRRSRCAFAAYGVFLSVLMAGAPVMAQNHEDESPTVLAVLQEVLRNQESLNQRLTDLAARALVRVETGVISLDREAYPGLWQGDSPYRGARDERVEFQEPFSAPPAVTLGITLLDADNANSLRLLTSV